MLHLIPAGSHRRLLRLAHRLRKLWWRVRRPRIVGCRVLALDEEGRVLLVRHSYGSGRWMPPGGGMRRDEEVLAAAARELQEEVGCAIEGAVEVATVEERLHGARNRVHVVAGRVAGLHRPDGREILEAGFFALGALPGHMPDYLREGLPAWVKAFDPKAG